MTTFIIHYYDGGTEYIDAYSVSILKNGKVTFDKGHGQTITRSNVVWVED